MIQGPSIHDPIPKLVEAVSRLEQWHYSLMPGSGKMALTWAQQVHFWSTMALAQAQDRFYDGKGNATGKDKG